MKKSLAVQPQTKLRSISVVIPAYGAAEVLRVCLESLTKYAPSNCTISVVDDATPDDSIRLLCESAQCEFPQLEYLRLDRNRGFVGACNWASQNARKPESDLLLLNCDTEITAGSLEELQGVLYLHERHGVVTPRSNNATIFSVPWIGGILPAAESYQLWQSVRAVLPRYQVMPTAVGFCMLIKAELLDRFLLFDEIYSPGYNEENDFVCRINRCGYSALAANWAYVFHHEGSVLRSHKANLDAANREILLKRYPEYERKIADYARFFVDPVEVFADLIVPHRSRILFDLFDLPYWHSGTSQFALDLLRALGPILECEFELYVGVGAAFEFFGRELVGYRLYDDRADPQTHFDLVFKPSQIFSWDAFRRINRLAPRLCYVLLDIIGVRCDYLSTPERRILFQKVADLSDCVFAISEFSRTDFGAFYHDAPPMRVIRLGTNLGVSAAEFREGEYILVMGNSYAHKAVSEALRELSSERQVVVLGGDPPDVLDGNVRWMASGDLTRQEVRDLLLNARLLVYPSHYEGFGMPILDALALGKVVVVQDTEVNRELARMTGNKNLYRLRSLSQLQSTVNRVFDQEPTVRGRSFRRWHDAAREYACAFKEILAKDVDVGKLRQRWDVVRTLESTEGQDPHK
jgi:GT2 family glycosyltransferase